MTSKVSDTTKNPKLQLIKRVFLQCTALFFTTIILITVINIVLGIYTNYIPLAAILNLSGSSIFLALSLVFFRIGLLLRKGLNASEGNSKSAHQIAAAMGLSQTMLALYVLLITVILSKTLPHGYTLSIYCHLFLATMMYFLIAIALYFAFCTKLFKRNPTYFTKYFTFKCITVFSGSIFILILFILFIFGVPTIVNLAFDPGVNRPVTYNGDIYYNIEVTTKNHTETKWYKLINPVIAREEKPPKGIRSDQVSGLKLPDSIKKKLVSTGRYKTKNPEANSKDSPIDQKKPTSSSASPSMENSESQNSAQSYGNEPTGGLTLQNEMLRLGKYLYEQRLVPGDEFELTATSHGELSVELKGNKESQGSHVVDVMWEIRHNGTKKISGKAMDEFVLMKMTKPENSTGSFSIDNAEIIGFYLVDPSSFDIIDEHRTEW